MQKYPDLGVFDPLVAPPWELEESKQEPLISIGGPSGSADTRAHGFINYLSILPRNDTQIFTDESRSLDGNTGGGYVIFQFGLQVISNAFPLGKYKDSYDAEAHAALLGTRTAITLPSTRFANSAWIFIDNTDVARKLLTKTPSKSS